MDSNAIFTGRKESRAQHILMGFGFLAFLLPSLWFLVAFFPNPAAIVVGGSATLLWAVMLVLCFLNWAAAAATIKVDDEGFQIQGPLRNQRVIWSQVSEVSLGDRSTGAIRVHLVGGGTLLLRLDLIEDGQELGRRIRTKAEENNRDRRFPDRTYRLANLPIQIFLFGGGGLLMIFGWIWMVPSSQNKWVAELMLAGMIGAYIVGVVKQLSIFARIQDGKLTYGSSSRRWTVNIDSITAIAVAERAGSPILLRSGGSYWTMPSGLAEPDGLVWHLESATGLSRQTELKPEPIPLTQRIEVGPGIGFYQHHLGLGAVWIAVLTFGVVGSLQDHSARMGPMMFVYFGLFGSMFGSTIWLFLCGWARYVVDGHTMERKAWLKPWKISLDDVEMSWLRGTNLSIYRLQVKGTPLDVDLGPLKNGARLIEAISTRLPSKTQPIKKSEFGAPKGVSLFGGFGVVLLVASVMVPVAYGKIPLALFGLLIVAVTYIACSKRYTTTAEGIWCRNGLSKRFTRYSEIKRLEVDDVPGKYGYIRRFRIELPQGGETITSQTEDVTLLEAILRNHLNPDQIHDSTGPT